MGDQNFERSVVLMIDHAQHGAVGLVLNRPTQIPIAEFLPEWTSNSSLIHTIFEGGPVEPDSFLALGRFIGEANNDRHYVFANVGIIDLGTDPLVLPPTVSEIKIFSGYSGWGPMQLDSELASDAWFVVEADPFDIFSSNHQELWSMVLRRQEGPMAWLSNYPSDPRLN